MRVGTRLAVLLYKDKKFVRAVEINTENYRLDDGIGYSLWDINERDKEENMKKYRLTEEEYEAVLFEYFWLEDLLVKIDNYYAEMDYSKVNANRLSKPSTLKKLLEKMYLTEREQIQEDFADLSSKIRNHRQNLTQVRAYMGEIHSKTADLSEVLSAMDTIERKYIGHYDKVSLVNLFGILTGVLMDISDDFEVKIIMFAG